jgi:hypothetical protein
MAFDDFKRYDGVVETEEEWKDFELPLEYL